MTANRWLGTAPFVLFMALAWVTVLATQAEAVLSYNLEPVSGWPNQAHYDAAVAAIQAVTSRYNAYAPNGFNNYNVYVYYDSGIPTAQASWGGSIGFGGTYPNARVTQHEMAHYVGLPNWSSWNGTSSGLMAGGVWSGSQGSQLIQQFEGDGVQLHGDSQHFWPYGLNYDSEWSELAAQRQVALAYAMRADMGIGPTAHPSSATTVNLTATDAVGESGFNYKTTWSDGYFAHASANYYTGDFAIRTPASANSFTFAGGSLTLNNTNGVNGGLYYKGTGTTGVITFNNLILNGGLIQHLNASTDLFQLDGNLTVQSASGISPKQGNINILADVHGTAPLTVQTGGRYSVRFYSNNNDFTGNLINTSRFELASGANFKFAIGDPGVNNAITGPTAASTLLNGTFELDIAGAAYNYGNSWQLVTSANTTYGATFNFSGFTNNGGIWSDGSFKYNQATGVLSVAPGSDLNSDGTVDLADWLIFSANHLADLSGYTPEQRAALGDLDGDGVNDYSDFFKFRYQYESLNGVGAFAALFNTTVPEPATVTLLLLAASLTGLRRRLR